MCFKEVNWLPFYLYNIRTSKNLHLNIIIIWKYYVSSLVFYTKLTGSLVMEHPGTHPLPIQGKPTIFGGVNGSIGMLANFSSQYCIAGKFPYFHHLLSVEKILLC